MTINEQIDYVITCLEKYGNVAVVTEPEKLFSHPRLAEWHIDIIKPLSDRPSDVREGIPKVKNYKHKSDWWGVWAHKE